MSRHGRANRTSDIVGHGGACVDMGGAPKLGLVWQGSCVCVYICAHVYTYVARCPLCCVMWCDVAQCARSDERGTVPMSTCPCPDDQTSACPDMPYTRAHVPSTLTCECSHEQARRSDEPANSDIWDSGAHTWAGRTSDILGQLWI